MALACYPFHGTRLAGLFVTMSEMAGLFSLRLHFDGICQVRGRL